MEIKTLDIQFYDKSNLIMGEDGLVHKKSLPYLSVVQAIEGSYGIGIDGAAEENTGNMGVFVAPAHKMQLITHNVDEKTKQMLAHWVFLNIKINSTYDFDEIFQTPLILPLEYNDAIYSIIDSIKKENICQDLSRLYLLLDILIKNSTMKTFIDPLKQQIKEYINNFYNQKIDLEQMARELGVSTPTLFRKFSKYFSMSPSNYINDIRLQKASFLLEKSGLMVKEIAGLVGISDMFYFSKLFKKKYGVSPQAYRNFHRAD